METKPIINGIILFLLGLLIGGVGNALYLSARYNTYITKYGSCVTDYNKLSLKMIKYQTTSIQEVSDLTSELLACKEHLVGTTLMDSEP